MRSHARHTMTGLMAAAIGLAPAWAAGQTPADSTLRREKLPSRSAWEVAAALPGWLVLVPFEVVLGLTSATIGILDDTHAVARTEDFLVADDGSRALLPAYAARGGIGAVYVQRGLFSRSSKLQIRATGGTLGRQLYSASLERVRFLGGRAGMSTSLQYRLLPDEPFFGIGQDTRDDSETNFGLERTALDLGAELDLSRSLLASAGVGWTSSNVRSGRGSKSPSAVSLATTPDGFRERPRLLRWHAALGWDSRDHRGRPTRGAEARLGGAYAHELGPSTFGFASGEAAYTRYLHLGYGRALAVGAAAEVQEPLRDRRIPFYELTELGGRETLRGFDRGRFRDQGSLRGSAEYRFPVQPGSLDGALFVDAGRVFSDLGRDEVEREVHVGYGFGFRLWNVRSTWATFDVAHSREGWHAYVSLN